MRIPRARWALALAFFLSIVPTAPGGQDPAAWRLETTDLRIELDPGRSRLRGEARLSLAAAVPGDDAIVLDLNDELSVASVTDPSGHPLAFEREGARLTVRPADRSGALILRVAYEGTFSKRNVNVGYYPAWIGPELAYGLSGAWYPQQAGDVNQARGSISYLVPAGWTVASVGRPAGASDAPEGRRFDFEVASPMGYSFAAGPFQAVRRRVDGLEIGVFLLGGGTGKGDFYLENCARVAAALREYYGGIPFDGLTVTELPQDLLGSAGGKASQSFLCFPSPILPEGYFFAPAFAHEIGHLFWGRVQSAAGPIISEGLAEVSMGLYLEKAFGERAFRAMLKNGSSELMLAHSARLYFRAIQAPLAGAVGAAMGTIGPGGDVPLGVWDPGRRNTLHTLANSKGWFVFTMLRDLIGPEAFRAGLRGAMSRYDGKSLDVAGLRAEFETAAGRDLGWFFEQWFFRTGAPEFALTWTAAPRGAGWEVKGRIRQTRDVYRVAAEVAFVASGAREIRVVEFAAESTDFSFLLPFQPVEVLFDPDYRILRWTEEFKQ